MNLTKKTTLLLLVALLIGSFSAFGQTGKEQAHEYVNSQKIAFFTETIGLTPEEAEKFWPVYNAYWQKKNAIIQERQSKMNYYQKNYKSLSESQMNKLADGYIHQEVQKAQLLKEYHEKFKDILPIHKVMKIYKADYQFKEYLLNKIKNSGEDTDQ
jgi:hypothetical protein